MRARWAGMPASVNVSLASRWCSASMSTVVRTPSARMPRSSQSPETPVPVPISTTARASRTEARKRRAAPPPEPIGDDADLLGAGAGGGEDLVLGDELLGVGPARGLDRGGDGGLLVGRRGRTARTSGDHRIVTRRREHRPATARCQRRARASQARSQPHRVLSGSGSYAEEGQDAVRAVGRGAVAARRGDPGGR